MKLLHTGILSLGFLCLTAAAVQAETKVTITETHLCCRACVVAVNKATENIQGAKVECNQDDETITITAKSDAIAQQAVDAIANTGFYGKSDSQTVKFKAVENIPAGKVKRLELHGVHNCCGGCNRVIKAALAKVDGVSADTAKPRSDEIVIEGDFDATEAINALLAKGFYARVKK